MEKEMTANFKRIFFFFTLLILGLSSQATSKVDCQNSGFKYIKNYSRKDYNNQSQNWSILQDKRGIIYVANHGGVLEYDGVYWRSIDVPNYSVRSLAIDDIGTIYVGGNNEIGYLAPDSKGTLQYMSLLDYLDDNKRNFGNVWRTHSTKEGIYFRTTKCLFRWNANDRQMKAWKTKHEFISSFTCNDKLFIQQKDVGLMQMANDSLKFLPGSEIFATIKIYMMVYYNTQKLLILTRENGCYIYDYDANILKHPQTIMENYLKENEFYHGILLSTSDFALATIQGGLVVIDAQGDVKKIFNKTSGLQDDCVNYVFEDSQGNLWLALDIGISKIEYTSTISFYNGNRSNLAGLVLSVIRYAPHNDLYVGTTSGLFFLESPSAIKFHRYPVKCGGCWFLLSVEDSLLAATGKGVFQIESNIKWAEVIKDKSLVLHQSKKESNRIWVGTAGGLVSLYREDGKWTKESQFEDITEQIRTIVEDPKGNLWLGPLTKDVLKVDFPGNGSIKNPVVTRYNTANGLPPGPVRVYMASGHVMFATDKGILRFDKFKKIFVPDAAIGDEFADGSRGVFRIVEDKNKNIWLHSSLRNFQAILLPDGTYVIYKKPFLRLPDIQVNAIYPDGDAIWFASDEGLIRYDPNVKKNYDYDFLTLIRKVLVKGKLVFNGTKFKKDDVSKSNSLFPEIAYKDRDISFQFAAPFFESESSTRYQCFLEGYDNDWSEWTSKTNKDYTNLDAGLYTFRVQAKNVYGKKGSEATFKFKILPPWHQTWWAFLMYDVTILFIMYLVVKWRLWKLVREKKRLEGIIKDRTKEIIHKNQQLEQKTAQLEEQAEKLKEMDKIKSRFFSNISHEFRTPLTLIMGPLEQMLSNCRSKEQKKKFNLMLRNSQRLFTLINQLLELSRFDSGKVKLHACRQNIIPFLKGIAASFEPVVNKNELDLTFHAEDYNITLYFDPQKLEQVILNLLSNAVKFTPVGGRITLNVSKSCSKKESFPSGSVNISVSDKSKGDRQVS